jgi:hypothetical protein
MSKTLALAELRANMAEKACFQLNQIFFTTRVTQFQ